MGSCVFKPTIKNKEGVEVESKLFNDLLLHTGNRESTKTIWGLAQVSLFTDMYSELKHDDNGEVTLESLDSVLKINDMLEGKTTLVAEKREVGAIDNKNEPILYESLEDIMDKVVAYNQENQDTVATVEKSGGKFKINLNHKTADNSEDASKLMFSHTLNNKLRGIMRSLGFDVETKEGLTYDGIFDALSGKETAEGLRTVIEVAKGEVGELAFPEEFAHFIIEGLLGEPLVARLVESLKDTAILELILGEDYEKYSQLYDGNVDTLAKEAAGKLLQALITKNDQIVPAGKKGILDRIWNFFKNKIKSLKQSDIDNAINEANEGFAELASLVMDQSILPLFNKSRLMDSKPLYKVAKDVNLMEKMATDSLKLLSKRLILLHGKSKNAKMDENYVKAVQLLQELINGKKYAQSSILFLKDILLEIQTLHLKVESLVQYQTKYGSNLSKLNHMSGLLLSIEEFSLAYQEVVLDMTTMEVLQERGEVELSKEDARDIAQQSSKILGMITDINRSYKDMRYDTMYQVYSAYLGKDAVENMGDDKTKLESLEIMMKLAPKDINGLDRWINSLGDSSDLLLVLTDKMFKLAHGQRDQILQYRLHQMRAIHKKLSSQGYDTDFMYERTEDGKLTGMLISDIDFAKYNTERTEFIQSLKNAGTDNLTMLHEIEEWERMRNEDVILDHESERTENVPMKSMYPSNKLDSLSPAQREYYDAMMLLKGELDNLIPARFAKTFKAVQIRNGLIEGLIDKAGNPKQVGKLLMESLKDKFLERSDDTDFGNIGENGKHKSVLTDFAGKKVETLPVYYTHPIEDTDRLSTDFTSSLLAYANMAVNYSEMNKVRNTLELSRSFIMDRDVQQFSGDRKLMETVTAAGSKFQEGHVKKGRETNMGGRINDYYSANMYGQKKIDEGTKKIFGLDVSVAKTLDTLKSYTTQVGLGLNLFTAINNVTMGKLLMFIESMGGEYYNYKDAAKGKLQYYLMLPELLSEVNSITKSSKLGLLIDKFDALEEFNQSTQGEDFMKSNMGRILGKTNMLILSSAGEHYLHARNMLAMMNSYKMLDASGKEISMFDAYEVEKHEDNGLDLGGQLRFKEGVTKLDGKPFSLQDEITFKMRVAKVSQSLNGAFNDIDKGAVHRYALGRLAMQFRQWMPAHYLRRMGGKYYDALLSQDREGYYRTSGKFVWETLKDARRMNFQLMTRWHQLNTHEKANMKRSATELVIFGALALAISMMGPLKDMSDNWAQKMLLYQLQRVELEVGALVPFHKGFFDDLLKLALSPAAAMKNINDFGNLLNFMNLWNEVESGRYKGWNAYLRDVFKVTPYVGQFQKVRDLATEDYMFSIFSAKMFK